jgi:hypothetical protein
MEKNTRKPGPMAAADYRVWQAAHRRWKSRWLRPEPEHVDQAMAELSAAFGQAHSELVKPLMARAAYTSSERVDVVADVRQAITVVATAAWRVAHNSGRLTDNISEYDTLVSPPMRPPAQGNVTPRKRDPLGGQEVTKPTAAKHPPNGREARGRFFLVHDQPTRPHLGPTSRGIYAISGLSIATCRRGARRATARSNGVANRRRRILPSHDLPIGCRADREAAALGARYNHRRPHLALAGRTPAERLCELRIRREPVQVMA